MPSPSFQCYRESCPICCTATTSLSDLQAFYRTAIVQHVSAKGIQVVRIKSLCRKVSTTRRSEASPQGSQASLLYLRLLSRLRMLYLHVMVYITLDLLVTRSLIRHSHFACSNALLFSSHIFNTITVWICSPNSEQEIFSRLKQSMVTIGYLGKENTTTYQQSFLFRSLSSFIGGRAASSGRGFQD